MQKKRRIWVIAGILIILIIAISFLWIFYKPKDEKVLPHANEITDWKQYSSDELNSIFSKSGLRETEQLLITLSEEEKKELVEKCPYLKEEGTVLVNYNGDDGYTHVYSSSILKEADTYKKEAVEQNRKKYLEQKQEKGELTESEASELSTFATVPDNAGSLSLERYISQLYGDQCQLTSLTTTCYLSFVTFTNNKSIVSSKDYSTVVNDINKKYWVSKLIGDLTDKQIYKEIQDASKEAYSTLNITLAEKSFYRKKVPIEKIAVTFSSDVYKNFYGFSSPINYQKKTTLANGALCSVSGHHGTSDGASIVVIEGFKYFLPTGCYPISTKQFNDSIGRYNFSTYPKLVDCTKGTDSNSSYFKQCELLDTQKQTFGLKSRDEKYDTDSEMFYKKGHMTFVSDTIDIQINIGSETSEGLGRQLYDKWFKVNKDCNTFEKIYKQVSWYKDEEERRDAAQTLFNLYFGGSARRDATCRTIALVHNFEALKLDLGGGVIKNDKKTENETDDYSTEKNGVYKYDDLADNVLADEDNYLIMDKKAAGLKDILEDKTTTDGFAYQTSDTKLSLSMKYLKTQLWGTEGLSALDKLDIRTNVVRRGYLLNKVTLDKASTNAVGVLYKGKYYVGDNSDESNEYKTSKTDGYAKSFLLYKSTDDAVGLIGDTNSFDLTKYTYAYGSNLENYSEDTAENKKIYSAITFHWKNTAPKINPGNADTSSFNPTTATDKTLYKTGTYDEKYNEYKVVINADEYAGKTYSEILKDVLKNAQVTVTDKEDEANSASADKLRLNPDIPTVGNYNITDLSKYDMSTCEHADKLFIKISNSSVKGTDDLCSNATEKSLLTDATCETIELRVHDFSQEKDGYDKCKIYVYVYGNGVIKTPSPTPTGGVDVTSAPSQNISASVTRHTSHKFTEAEILAICPILPPQTEQTAPPFTYTQTSQSYQEDNRKVVETELLNKRLSPGTYTIHVDTTYTITYNWKHNHISSCACPGHSYTDKDGNTHTKTCGSYCQCHYSAEKTTQQQYHSHNLNKDTYVTITIVNCDPKIEIAKKTVNRTEVDTINWGTITEGISEIKDHEDMSIHSGVGVTCGVCAGTEIDYTVWKNISNAMNATETTGKIKFEKKPIERSGIGKEKAEITIDIGKLRLNQQNPGGKYPIKIEVTDSDGATTTNEFTVDIDWSKPNIPESTNPSGDNYYIADYTKNGLIYHTNEIISQLDFYTTNVLKVTDVLNVNGQSCDYATADTYVNTGNESEARGWNYGNGFRIISRDLLSVRDSNNYPKYIKIINTSVGTKPLYVSMRGKETQVGSSDQICSINNSSGEVSNNTEQVAYRGEDGNLSNEWRECNSVVTCKECAVTIRIYNPRNHSYFVDVTVKVLVKNEQPMISAGNHLLVLYEEYTDDLFISYPSTKAWDYEDETGSYCRNSVGSSSNGVGAAKVVGRDWNNNTYPIYAQTSRFANSETNTLYGINKKTLTTIQAQCVENKTFTVPRRNNGLTFMDRFVITKWDGQNMSKAGSDAIYYDTHHEGYHTLEVTYYDQDGAEAHTTFTVQVRKTEAQMKPHIRFINKFFATQDESFGGIENDSIWSQYSPYKNTYYNFLMKSLNTDVSNANESNNWLGCTRVYRFYPSDIREAKTIVKNHVLNKSFSASQYQSGVTVNGSVWNFNNTFISWLEQHRLK